MAISVYQVDSVIKAYNKQTQVNSKNKGQNKISVNDCNRDYVTISDVPVHKAETFEKISYNVRDIIIKRGEP